MSGATRSSIEVAIRVRPMRPEIHETKSAWEITATTAREVANPDTSFTFDHIYGTDSTTQDLYQRSVRDSIVSRVAQGYNGTVFAYGQTGSGKTFTMFGSGDDARGRRGARPARQAGLIELSVQDLFAALNKELAQSVGSPLSSSAPVTTSTTATGNGGKMKRYEVFVSELEIYNEQLRDLLLPEGQKAKPLSIRENEYGVYVHNATRRLVHSAEDCLYTIYKHAEARVSASTAMNDESSRSHCIIQLHVEKTLYVSANEDSDDDSDDEAASGNEDDGTAANTTEDDFDATSIASSSVASVGGGRGTKPVKSVHLARVRGANKTKKRDKKKLVSLLNLVDLAGSERVSKTGATGQRMVEGGHINKSLTALTTVINRLAEINNNANGGGAGGMASTGNNFVPYRDSRLTHLLKTSIGGNSFTCIFCCVTPALENVDESRSTLQFASRAKRIKNRVSVNEVMNPKARIRELEVELRRVKRQLVAQTIYLWSKQVTIKHLQARLDTLVRDAEGNGGDLVGTQSAASFGSAGRRRLGPEAQRQMIMAQLQARNEALEEELAKLKAGEPVATVDGAGVGTESVAQLRADVADLEAMLRDMETEKKAAQQQADEMNVLCCELEAANAKQATTVKQLEERVKEAEGLLDDLDDERAGAVSEAELLREQLQKTQAKLLERSHGDAYLEDLTQLHIAHQELQFHHNQLKESSARQLRELQGKLTAAQQDQEDIEDEKEEVRDKCKQLNAYLWRFLAIASLASKGRVDDELANGGGAVASAERPVPERQIAAALESLTKAVSAARAGQALPGTVDVTHSSTTAGPVAATPATKKEVAALKAKVRELETQLIYKDAQRDVLVDTKLKRMQDLVLRLHAINNALMTEMRQCYSDNDELFHLAQKHPKLAGKLSKAGLFPRSLQSALERARFAEPAEKPFGHN